MSASGAISTFNKQIDVSFGETNLNMCPAILNAIFGLVNSVGSIGEVSS